MKHFQIRTCPLCSKKLKVGDEDSIYTYYCEEFYLRGYSNVVDSLNSLISYDASHYHQGYFKEPHYAIYIADGVWTQSTVVPPYWIISTSDSNTSKIYKFSKQVQATDTNLLMEVPIIVPSDYLPEQFAKKIKNLVIFS